MKKWFIASLLFASCTNGSEKITATDSPAGTMPDTPYIVAGTPAIGKNDSTIAIQFEQGSNTAAITADLLNGKPLSVLVNVNKGSKLMAVVKNVTPGLNLRINQLHTPSGSTDGPFGNRLDYKAADSGTYRIVVGSNLMAEGVTSGKFNMVIGVENKPQQPIQ
ncbi:hypothetical protein EXU57_07010 [Segetibacter sp. 3557_3]|uniref:hypothetical protein n=1 Tax=Segetibacter sp. 3557_3 TaxID=2547429 RepID=UPI001058C6FE|nr:hypothetical protein [Segetibacter sp. 3557_3]TDH27330.1 hypothetical protein EXU57_07010 [Segetibacter sp. 3557_3]